MKKKILSILLGTAMVVSLAACGNSGSAKIESAATEAASAAESVAESVEEKAEEVVSEAAEAAESVEEKAEEAVAEVSEGAEDFHIGIVTGSVSQSEDDRRGAEAFQAKYGEDVVKLAIYPDNFTEELETTIQTIVNLSDDPLMKAIIVNQAIPGTTEAFRQIKERRPDIICIAGESHEDLPEIGSAADLVVNNDFVARGYLMIRTAHELGCDTFVHISFPRHLSYETMSRRVAIMKEACNEFGMKFEMETAPDPTTDVGVPGAQAYILEHVPEWIDKYGTNSAYFCTNDAHTEPLLKQLLEYGGYFIEADLPSPLMGYPGALGLDLTEEAGDFQKILAKVESAVVEKGGEGRFGTWAYSYGYTVSAGLAEHARNVILGESELDDIDDISAAYGVFSPGAEWNGSNYTNVDTGVKADNTFLIYQDTYIMGNPGHYMGSTEIEVPEKYFTVK
jgi:DNA-binding LacI/PurR family transcriptional regulator